MAVRPIVILGDPVLHTPTSPVPVGADGSLPADLGALIKDMYDTMDAANGVGLAANQIGVGLRRFVFDCADDRGLTSRRRGVVVGQQDAPITVVPRGLSAPTIVGSPRAGAA